MHAAKEAFDAVASQYDAQRKYIIPEFEDFYLAAVRAAAWPGKNPSILDIGAGTGLLSTLLLQKYPEASLTLIDFSENMLAVAGQRFSGRDWVTCKLGDYRTTGLGGPYDMICSALSIHHLEHREKRSLYARIFNVLSPRGVFVNAEQFFGETPEQHLRYMAYWNDFFRHGPLPEAEWKSAMRRRDALDRTEKLSVQLDWLREIGFSEVDVVYKNRMMAVITGVKALREGDSV